MQKTIISEGLKCEGSITSKASLVIFGNVEGKIDTSEYIVIEPKGIVKGEIFAKTLQVKGLFEGIADCETIEVLKGGKFIGTIKSNILVIDREGLFEGKSEMKNTIKNDITKIPIKKRREFKDLDTENILL